MKLDEEARELAQEVIGSAGWRILVNEILRTKIEAYSNAVYQHARKGDTLQCAASVAKRDAVFEIIEAIYTSAQFTIPENLKALKRGD